MRKCTWSEANGGKTIQKYGYFHQFGLNCSSDAEGCGVQWTEALVEDADGNIKQFSPYAIRFIPDNFTHDDFNKHKQDFGF